MVTKKKKTRTGNVSISEWHCCSHGGYGFPLFLILIGVVWAGSRLGWFSEGLFWPAVVIVAGIVMLFGNIFKRCC